MTFTSTINTFNDFLPLQTAAPPQVNSLIRPCTLAKIYGSSVAERVIVADFYTCPLLSRIPVGSFGFS